MKKMSIQFKFTVNFNLFKTKCHLRNLRKPRPLLILVFIIVVHLLLSSLTIKRYSRVDFSGEWNFQKQEAVSGPQYGNAVPVKVTISENPDSLHLLKVSEDENGRDFQIKDDFDFKTEKYTSITPMSKRKKVCTLQWSDQDRSFTELENFYALGDDQHVETIVTDTWSLSVDGGILTLLRVSKGSGDKNWSTKAIYIKKH